MDIQGNIIRLDVQHDCSDGISLELST